MNACNETFLSSFSTEELILLFRMQLASGWDIYPDHWEFRQIGEALRGIAPQWTDDETPKYEQELEPGES